MVGKHHNMEEEKKNFKRCENNFLKKQIKEKTRKKSFIYFKSHVPKYILRPCCGTSYAPLHCLPTDLQEPCKFISA